MSAALRLIAATLAVMLSAGAANAATRAHYIVMRLAASGKIEPELATEVALQGKLRGHGSSDREAPSRRDSDQIAVTLRGPRGRVRYRDVVELPRALRGEFHGASGKPIDGHYFASRDRAFVLKLPATRNGVLELAAPGARSPSRFQVDELLKGFGGRLTYGAAVMSPLPLEGWINGDAENRVDVLVLGDGYNSEEEAEFDADALAVVNGMFAVSPYQDYHNYVNALALFTPSLESGADQPPYDPLCSDYGFNQSCCGDGSAAGRPGNFVETAFDASYCTLDIQRLLTVNATKVFSAAAEVPDWDQILVIVNSSEYGGSGGGLSVISLHASAIEIAQHEYGHTFAALADEYTTAYPGYPACSDTVAGAAVCERNVTDETNRELVKWARWVDETQAVPSSGAPPIATDAGLWIGARYQSTGMYRQGYACIMRFLGAPFCDVAAEAYAMRLYEGGWGLPPNGIDVIEPGTESPAPGDIDLLSPGGVFSVRVLGPEAGPPLDVRWVVDDVEVEATSVANGDIAIFALAAGDGHHSLQLRVTDVSPILHAATQPTFTSTRTWNVQIGPAPTTTLPGTTTTTTTGTPSTTVTVATSTTTTTLTLSTTTTLPPSTTTTFPHDSTTTTLPASTTTSTLASHPLCAQPISDGDGPLATDCLYILEAAVGITTCTSECACAPKGSLPIMATDALVCLYAAVGGSVELNCPCGPFP